MAAARHRTAGGAAAAGARGSTTARGALARRTRAGRSSLTPSLGRRPPLSLVVTNVSSGSEEPHTTLRENLATPEYLIPNAQQTKPGSFPALAARNFSRELGGRSTQSSTL